MPGFKTPDYGLNPDGRRGAKGALRLSNRTENDSAKMATAKGAVQGYTGVAAVDVAHQIVVDAQAHGTGSEQEPLLPVIDASSSQCRPYTAICADARYHSEKNLAGLESRNIPAWVCDNRLPAARPQTRRSGETQAKPDALWDKSEKARAAPTASKTSPTPTPTSLKRTTAATAPARPASGSIAKAATARSMATPPPNTPVLRGLPRLHRCSAT